MTSGTGRALRMSYLVASVAGVAFFVMSVGLLGVWPGRVLERQNAGMLDERFLNLGVLRQYGEVGDAKAFCGLAFGEAVVLVAVLDHEPRGLAGNCLSHQVASHGPARHQKIGSSFCGVEAPSTVPSPETPAGR